MNEGMRYLLENLDANSVFVFAFLSHVGPWLGISKFKLQASSTAILPSALALP